MKGLPVYVPLRERTPIIYGPSLLLLLAACGGGPAEWRLRHRHRLLSVGPGGRQ